MSTENNSQTTVIESLTSATRVPETQHTSAGAKPTFADNPTESPTVLAGTSVPRGEPQHQQEYSWEVEKMSEEELEQLEASYQKLRITPSPTVTAEVERRRHALDNLGTKSGRHAEKIPTMSIPGATEPQSKSSAESPTPKRAIRTRHLSSWVWLVVGTLIFSALLGISLFNFVWQSMGGDPEKAGESIGKAFIPILVIGFSVVQARKSILKQASNADPTIHRRLRKIEIIGGILACTILITSLVLGATVGGRVEKNRKLNQTLDEMGKLGPKNAELREEIKTILSQDTPTFEDYYSRCLKLEKVLDEYDLQQRRVEPLLNDVIATSTDSKITEIATTLQRINNKDAEVVKIFRLEIAKSKELIKLPPSQQSDFYRQEIAPLEKQASKVADQEIEMMRDAEKKGLMWPSDVKDWLK